jgi:hypothetical protein
MHSASFLSNNNNVIIIILVSLFFFFVMFQKLVEACRHFLFTMRNSINTKGTIMETDLRWHLGTDYFFHFSIGAILKISCDRQRNSWLYQCTFAAAVHCYLTLHKAQLFSLIVGTMRQN